MKQNYEKLLETCRIDIDEKNKKINDSTALAKIKENECSLIRHEKEDLKKN